MSEASRFTRVCSKPLASVLYLHKTSFMGAAYQINDQRAVYFLTFQIVGWVDIFSRKVYRDVMVESLNFCVGNKQLNIYA